MIGLGTVASLAAVAKAADNTFHVAGPSGSGTQDGSNWANAMPSIDAALTAAASATGSSAIRVKEHGTTGGSYVPTVKLDPGSTDNRLKSFSIAAAGNNIANFLDVRGAFPASISNPTTDDRNGPLHPTRLSGDLGSSVHSYHVVSIGLSDERTRLDGFDISGGDGYTGAYPSYITDANNIGGGVFCISPPVGGVDETITWRPLIANCVIHDNESALGGGIGVRGNQGGEEETNRRLVTMTVQVCRIHNNGAGGGAGIGCFSSSVEVSNTILFENDAVDTGGGIAVLGEGYGLIRGCTIAYNVVTAGTTTDQRGGGVRVGGVAEGSTAQIWNSIIAFNAAPEGGYLDEIAGSGGSGNPTGTLGIAIFDSCVEDFPVPNPVTGQNLINDDPLFANATSDDFRLQDGSPCIDVGRTDVPAEPWDLLAKMPSDVWDVDEDLDTEELLPAASRTFRLSGCSIDFGAHERSPCLADIDHDGSVGAADLASLLGEWGPTWKNSRADLTGDSDVGAADLGALLGDWGCSYGCEFFSSSEATSSPLTIDIESAAAAYGFSEVVTFGEWLGSFGPDFAGNVLWSFSTSAGGDS